MSYLKNGYLKNEFDAWTNKLESMTADEIANLCESEGVTGKRFSGNRCAIANLLREKVFQADTEEAGEVDVNSGDVGLHSYRNGGVLRKQWTSSGPVEFVFRFDDGAYPELID